MIKKIWNEYAEIIGATLFLITIVLFVHYKRSDTAQEGVITIVKITGYEPAESGSLLFANAYIDDKIIRILVGETCNLKVGKFYFAKLKKDAPNDYPVVFCNKEVPECILDQVKYFPGWDKISDCK